MDLSHEAIDLTNNWWAVLLSGSASALIGAMATVAAVVIAFRLEHTRSREERVRAAMSATATRASALGWDWSLGGEPVDGWTREHLDAMRELISSVGNVIDACGTAEPVMRKQLEIIAFGIPEAERKVDGVNALSRLLSSGFAIPTRSGKVRSPHTPSPARLQQSARRRLPMGRTMVQRQRVEDPVGTPLEMASMRAVDQSVWSGGSRRKWSVWWKKMVTRLGPRVP